MSLGLGITAPAAPRPTNKAGTDGDNRAVMPVRHGAPAEYHWSLVLHTQF